MRAEPAAASVRAHGAENTTPAELARRNLFIEAALVLEEMEGRTSKTWSIAVREPSISYSIRCDRSLAYSLTRS